MYKFWKKNTAILHDKKNYGHSGSFYGSIIRGISQVPGYKFKFKFNRLFGINTHIYINIQISNNILD